jgi:hypothetical protein
MIWVWFRCCHCGDSGYTQLDPSEFSISVELVAVAIQGPRSLCEDCVMELAEI